MLALIALLAIVSTGQGCTIACDRDGKYANPNSRSSYILCRDGRPSLSRCELSGDGLNRKRFDGRECVEWFDCPKANGRFPYSNNEALYWSCDNGLAQLGRCLPGQIFDGHSHCVQTFDCPALTGLFPRAQNASEYYECCYGEARVHSCPKGYQFDADLRCVETFVCPQPNGRFRNIRNESQFYECFDDVPSLTICPEKHVFDGIEKCVEKFSCPLWEGRFYNPQDPTNRTYYVCTSNQPILQNCPHHYVFYGRECDEPFLCPRPDGRFKHPRNDSKYYMCENNFPYPHDCPPGLEFDDQRRDCVKAFRCPTSFGKFPHPDNRSLYYECYNGRHRVNHCPEETYFTDHDCVLSFVCPQPNGLFKHPTHPNKYYYCREGMATLQECPRDYHYDISQKNCIKRETPCPQPNGRFPYPTDDRIFYECINGEPSLRRCAANQKFEPRSQTCVDLNNRIDSHCLQPNGLFRDPFDETRYYRCRDGTAYPGRCGLNTRFDERIGICVDIFNCPALSGLFRHPTNESRFFHCVDGKPHLRECRIGLVFNGRDCTARTNPLCPEAEGMFPNPANESQFYYCRQNVPHLSECPTGQVFEPLFRRCVEKIYRFQCPQPNGVFPHPESEHRFYQCVNGVPHLRNCGQNEVFDRTYQRCLDRAQADECRCPQSDGLFAYAHNKRRYIQCRQSVCQIRECPINEIFDEYHRRCSDRTFRPNQPQCPQPNGMFRHETNSTRYYQCRDGRPELHECPAFYIFSEESQQCIPWSWPNNFYCPLPNGMFTNPQNQSQYFECCRGQATLRSCPSNQIFNGQHCVSDVIYRCENDYMPGGCINGHRYSYTCPYQYGHVLVYNGYRCVEPYHCPNSHGVHIIPNPVHHHQYYRCTDGRPSLNTCSRGYVYDPRRGCCVYAHYDYGERPQTYPMEQIPFAPPQTRPVDQSHYVPGVPVVETVPELPFIPAPPSLPPQETHEVIYPMITEEAITLPRVEQKKVTAPAVLRGDINGDIDGDIDEDNDKEETEENEEDEDYKDNEEE